VDFHDVVRIAFNPVLKHLHITQEPFDKWSHPSNPSYLDNLLNHAKSTKYELPFEHSEKCPSRRYRVLCQNESVKPNFNGKDLKLAVCMVIEDSEGKTLWTRRVKRLIFPHAWVLPGGHIDLGEDMEVGVVREIREECGIRISKEGNKYSFGGKECIVEPFYCFESNMVWSESTEKAPAAAHLIIFYKVKLSYPS
jgi:8-oxo-dGTP pyrophosphatase MutT (NUDIX family)